MNQRNRFTALLLLIFVILVAGCDREQNRNSSPEQRGPTSSIGKTVSNAKGVAHNAEERDDKMRQSASEALGE